MSSDQKLETEVENGNSVTIESAIEQAKRAFALKKYEQAVEHYATALELITQKHGDDAPETADLYFSYGKALLENAIAQSSVLGKEQDQADENEENPSVPKGSQAPILSFSGDAEDEGGEEPTVDLFAPGTSEPDTNQDDDKGEDDEDGNGEPEDDFNAAWEVLDLARAIYTKQSQSTSGPEADEVKLKLADTYITLGDVSLETEKFDQAITDYTSGLDLKVPLLPFSSRQIAEAEYKLSMVLDLTPGRLSDAIVHAEKALDSVETRLAELRDGLNNQLLPKKEEAKETDKEDLKGKGKAKAAAGGSIIGDDVRKMTKAQIEGEIKELGGLKDDLALKVEELKTSPNEPVVPASAPILAAQALDKELNGGSQKPPSTVQVNDLTTMVKKKKKKDKGPNGESSSTKRKADEDTESPTEKKAKTET